MSRARTTTWPNTYLDKSGRLVGVRLPERISLRMTSGCRPVVEAISLTVNLKSCVGMRSFRVNGSVGGGRTRDLAQAASGEYRLFH